MLTRRHSTVWPRLAAAALIAAGIPLLGTFGSPPAPRSVSSAGWPAPLGGAWERPGELVIELRDGAAPAQVEALASRLHLQLADNSPLGHPDSILRAKADPADAPR